MTWTQLEATTSTLARQLLGLGVQPGDRVASLMPNRPALIVHYLACMKAGLVATPLNYRYQPPEIDHALAVSRPATFLAHAERAEDLAASSEVPRLPLGTITYGGGVGSDLRFEDLMADAAPDIELPAPDLDAPAFVFFTSGSTGRPKGVTHSHRTFGWVAASFAPALEITAQDVVLAGSSLSHIGSTKLALGGLSVGPPSASPAPSMGISSCRCSARPDRRWHSSCRQRSPRWYATTTHSRRTSPRSAWSCPAATRSPLSSSRSSPMSSARMSTRDTE